MQEELSDFVKWLRALSRRASEIAGRIKSGSLRIKDYDDMEELHDLWWDGRIDFRKKERADKPTLSE